MYLVRSTFSLCWGRMVLLFSDGDRVGVFHGDYVLLASHEFAFVEGTFTDDDLDFGLVVVHI